MFNMQWHAIMQVGFIRVVVNKEYMSFEGPHKVSASIHLEQTCTNTRLCLICFVDVFIFVFIFYLCWSCSDHCLWMISSDKETAISGVSFKLTFSRVNFLVVALKATSSALCSSTHILNVLDIIRVKIP